MKLLLTSAGLSNDLIKSTLRDLVTRPINECSAVFITTAANAEEGDKDWLVKDLVAFQELGWKSFDVLDFAGLPNELWQKRIELADVVIVGGGNTPHLLRQMKKTGFDSFLHQRKDSIAYVGISAGSIVVTPSLQTSTSQKLYDEGVVGEDDKALGWVSFYVRPHVNNPYFPKVNFQFVEELSKSIEGEVYALDDESAIKVEDEKVEVVSIGEWKKFN